MQDMPRDSAP